MLKGNKKLEVSLDELVENFAYNVDMNTFTNNQSMGGIMHYHHHYEILYVTEGERILYLNDDKYVLDNSCIVLLPPYVFHGSGSGESEKQTRYMISFKDTFVPHKGKIFDVNLSSCFNLKQPIIELNENQKEEVMNLLERMILLYQTKENVYDKLSFSFYLCNLLILCIKIQSQNIQLTPDNPNMTSIIKYIEKNYNEDITLDKLSKHFLINKYTLSRQFKNYTGVNILRFLNKIRITKSKEMLSETDQKITDIAGDTGYNNTTHFNRVFKEENGCSPSEYRLKYRNLTHSGK